MARIDKNGVLWIHSDILRSFKSGEVKDLIFKDEVTNKNKRIAICVEKEKEGRLTHYKPICVDNPATEIIQYLTL